MMLDVELTSGQKIRVFRAIDCVAYFCHGLTFGGKEAPGGAVSPFSGKDVTTILDNHYLPVKPMSKAQVGDILVWKGLGGDSSHSAILMSPIMSADLNDLDYSSLLRSKNGRLPERTMTLQALAADEKSYGEVYSVYRRK
jgi:hypothetical protein